MPGGGHYRAQPSWRKATTVGSLSASHELRQWLRYPRSLTAALTAACCEDLSVRLLSQGSAHSLRDEAIALGLGRGSRPVVREVQLCCGAVPWVFARTVIPHATLKGAAGRLLRLGTRPLGAVLFADPGVRHSQLQAARLQSRHQLFVLADGDCGEGGRSYPVLWARRCIHHLESRPLLVTEVFLDAIVEGGMGPPRDYGNV